ncbi:MAG: glutathione S-transferase family protein [Immundisolibacter sp.]|uniref:glutathione S-transferase family protein n=1 Tax=Immundisolibacter sp. TaxID=1934948 RepID=UPI003D141828
MLRLYHILPRADHPGSHNALKVAVLLRELGLDFELIDVDPVTALRPADAPLRTLNPNGLTPILDDDGFILWESAAILQYLCDSRGPTPLLPIEAKPRARVLQWLTWEASTVIPALMALYMARVSGGDDAAAVQRVDFVLGVLERQLNSRDWVADNYSIADIALGAGVPALLSIGVDFAAYPAVRRWLSALGARPAWQDAIFLADLRAGGLA